MTITLTEFTYNDDDGVYYSSAILPEKTDTLLTVEAELAADEEVYLQQSLDGETWYDCATTNFACNPRGIQSYIEFQPGLYLRLASIEEFVWAKVLI